MLGIGRVLSRVGIRVLRRMLELGLSVSLCLGLELGLGLGLGLGPGPESDSDLAPRRPDDRIGILHRDEDAHHDGGGEDQRADQESPGCGAGSVVGLVGDHRRWRPRGRVACSGDERRLVDVDPEQVGHGVAVLGPGQPPQRRQADLERAALALGLAVRVRARAIADSAARKMIPPVTG